MLIDVVCPGCHKRFQVSEKFAGKTGPCPACKTVIQVPTKEQQVVIHAPEEFGPKDRKGRAVLKPIERTEVRISPVVVVLIVAGSLAALLVAFVLGRAFSEGSVPRPLLAAGALLLAPPLVLGGYTFLRNDELEPYRGISLGIRVSICAVIYAGLWGLYTGLVGYLLGGRVEVWSLVFIAPMLIGAGATASFSCLDLDFGNAAVHYCLYLLITIVMRLVMGLSPF